MANNNHKSHDQQEQFDIDMGLVLALSITFGAGFGNIVGDFSMGMGLGMGIGMIYTLIRERMQHKRGANVALTIMLAGFGIALLLWFAT